MACAKINDQNKPIIGLNSDPTRSVGHLCIPSKYTNDFERALDKLFAGDFKWKYRQRIRVTIEGDQAWDEPLEIHNQNLGIEREFRYLDLEPADESRSRTGSTSEASYGSTTTIPQSVSCLSELLMKCLSANRSLQKYQTASSDLTAIPASKSNAPASLFVLALGPHPGPSILTN